MTDWVLKGSIRGPAGEIPSVSQFLKIAGGALSNGDNENIASLLIMGEGTSLSLDTSQTYSNIAVNGPSGSNKKIRLQSSSSSSTFTMDDKSVGSITDTILSGSGNALATDKAVKDYVDTSIADIDIPEALPEGGTEGQVLTKTSEGEAWSDIPDALPAGGNTGQVLTKTSDGEVWSDIPDALPSGGTNGQVLTKTTDGEAWSNVPTELPQDGTTGQILKKGQSGAEWVDSIVVDTSVADVAARDSVAIVDDPDNPKSGIILKTDPETQKTIITGVGDKFVDEVHANDVNIQNSISVNGKQINSITDAIESEATGSSLVTDKAVKEYVEEVSGGVKVPTPSGSDGYVLTLSGEYLNLEWKAPRISPVTGSLFVVRLIDIDHEQFRLNFETIKPVDDSIVYQDSFTIPKGSHILFSDSADFDGQVWTVNSTITMGLDGDNNWSCAEYVSFNNSMEGNAVLTPGYIPAKEETLATASNQDFCTYFGLQYDAVEWGDA